MARRFARLFEFDRNGPPWAGTPEQQLAVRGELQRLVRTQPRFDYVLWELDKVRNEKGSHFVPISFAEFDNQNVYGFAYPSRILFRSDISPQMLLSWVLIHELGHVVGWNLLSPKDSSEMWAEEFRNWVISGCPDGPVWDRLQVTFQMYEGR